MRHLTIKGRIMLWYTVVLLIIVLLTCTVLITISETVLNENIKEILANVVRENSKQIEIYDDDHGEENDIGEIYFENKGKMFEIDENFASLQQDVHTSLYNKEGKLIYGDNPLSIDLHQDFANNKISSIRADGEKYYVYDLKISVKDDSEFWLRGIVSTNGGNTILRRIVKIFLIAMPILMIIALALGYFVTGKWLKPVATLRRAADEIQESHDFAKRIPVGEEKDELSELAKSFNSMFDSIEKAFQKEKRFTSDVSHELRTPTAVILTQCEYLETGEHSKDEYIKAIDTFKRQGTKLSSITTQLLELTRMDRDMDKIPMEDVNLTLLIENLCSDLILVNQGRATLVTELDRDCHITGNATLLTRMISNLISNSYKYGKKVGNIKVTLENDSVHTVITVSDDGIGIRQEDLPKIWEPFYQVDDSRNPNDTKSFGLGLAMVQQIIQLHGGTAEVSSEWGSGTTFKIFF